ncbi:MAG: methyltransferase, partial [Proteobacteria bacterium]|nr:methyltransferase [Pseudomonadota bacterium]
NLGSAEVYRDNASDFNPVVYTLIKTHGMLGQYFMGEDNLDANREIHDAIIAPGIMPADKLRRCLYILNYCILNGVRDGLYESISDDMAVAIDKIIAGDFAPENFYDRDYILVRIKRLRRNKAGDDYASVSELLARDDVREKIGRIFEYCQMWYFNSALEDFSMTETLKIFLIISARMDDPKNYPHLSFQPMMTEMYRDYNGARTIDLFKKRIIESYLKSIDIESLIRNRIPDSRHISADLISSGHLAEFKISFSPQTQKLIEFVEVSYGEDETFNRAIMMLYDLFGFRRDAYDRFYNEAGYLKTMNASMTHKAKITDYIAGRKILDIGPGGGAMMDIVAARFPDAAVFGIDISQNVIESLERRRAETNAKWNVVRGDALSLADHFRPGDIDTVIYSSIIHELFSYIETNGRKFNYDTIRIAMESAYAILPDRGRVIIRDGIMTEPVDTMRVIEFVAPDGMEFLNNYCRDFRGRRIEYQTVGENRVMMRINDAMEFLYTYTWGPESYAHEVNEQFGYFTPTGFMDFFNTYFAGAFKIIEFKHFLQEGYEENLAKKIRFFDETGNRARLPDSTCILVAEAIK